MQSQAERHHDWTLQDDMCNSSDQMPAGTKRDDRFLCSTAYYLLLPTAHFLESFIATRRDALNCTTVRVKEEMDQM